MAEFGGGDYFQPTSNDTQKYQDVLEQEKDLFKNFEIDLIGALEKLTEEVAQTETKTGISEINFTLAGFVVQGSANVYGKKVDLLHGLTFQMLDNVAANYKDLNGGGDDRQPICSKNLEFKEIKLVDMNHETTVQSIQSTLPKRQLQITSIPDCLKNLENCQKDGDNMISKTGEDIGHPKDFSINRFTQDCINVKLSHQVTDTATISQNGDGPKNCLEFNDSDDEDDYHDGNANSEPFVVNFDEPVLGTSDESVLGTSNESILGTIDERVLSASDEHLQGSINNHSQLTNGEKEQRVDRIAYVEESVVKTKHSKAPTKCKALTQLNPHKVQVKDEKRPGLRKRVLVNSYTKTCESSPRSSKKRKSIDDVKSQAELKVKEEPFCDYFERTAHPENYSKQFLKNLPYYPLKSFAYQEFKRRGEIDKLKNQNVQIEEAQTDLNGDCNGTMICENQENGENPENGYDSGLEDNIPLENGFPDHVDSDHEGEFDHVNSSYKIMALNLQNMKFQSSQFKMSTDLSKRVESWNLHMNTILQEEHKRAEFDAKSYQAHILNCFDSEGQTINFKKVVQGKPMYDVGRYLVCSLFLANNMNVEINQGKVPNDMRMKLLSKEVRSDINEGIF